MTTFLTVAVVVIVALIAVGLHRVWRGPTIFDRLVAIALVSVNSVAVLVIFGFLFGRATFFLDIALVYALLTFLLPIALGRYFEFRENEEDAE
ncbi:MAG: monovalent cation/H+ antiporter complex subunit F [Nitriliruptoraceae bacterium]